MRYVEGSDLKELARDRDAMPPERVLRLGAQVASALDAAHERGLVHRDVKPANILVETGANGEDHAYLADFGLTKQLASQTGITGSGQFLGTIDYMAPEQIEGRKVDARADVYALGCVLYECLAGAPPYRKESDAAVLWAHMREDPPALTAARPDLPPAADAVFAKALAKDPDERYQTSGELVRELRRALGEAVPSPTEAPTVVGQPPSPPARRGRFPRAALLAAAALALGAGIASAAFLLAGNGSSRVETVTVPIRVVSFRTPTGTIGCGEGGSSLRCDIRGGLQPRPPRPSSCKLDWAFGYSLNPTGPAQVVCANGTVIDSSASVLRYGTSWKGGGFTCLSRSTGLRCANRTGHGFFLSRQRSSRF
jgi:hypothetical protein